MDFQEGEILYFDKPLHWTSFKLVKTLRNSISRALGIKKIKVGHAGTLDPLASGVMIICTGKSTKLIESFQYQTKEYIATLRLGATTPSHDLETEIDATYPVEHITRELVEQTLPRFVGTISQVPPAFSACKVDGRRAYKMARKGRRWNSNRKNWLSTKSNCSTLRPIFYAYGSFAVRGPIYGLWHETWERLLAAAPISLGWCVHE